MQVRTLIQLLEREEPTHLVVILNTDALVYEEVLKIKYVALNDSWNPYGEQAVEISVSEP